MPMSLRKTALSAALGATLVSAPLSAQDNTKKDADKGTPSSTTQTVKAEDLEKLRQDLADVRDAIRGKRADGYTVKGLAERVEELEKKLDSIEKLLIGIDNKLTTRTAGSSPIGGGAGDAVGTTGTVKVVNEYPSQISIVVNDKSAYRVEPNETKTITVPAGTFKYQLLRQSEVNRAIKAGETVTLWVR